MTCVEQTADGAWPQAHRTATAFEHLHPIAGQPRGLGSCHRRTTGASGYDAGVGVVSEKALPPTDLVEHEEHLLLSRQMPTSWSHADRRPISAHRVIMSWFLVTMT